MNVIIIGAGGQAQAVVEVLSFYEEYNIVGYLDNNERIHNKYISEKKVFGGINILNEVVQELNINAAIVAIGNSESRKKYFENIENLGLLKINAIHPKSIISKRAEIGEGVFIGAGVVIGPYSKIGNGCIVNINSVIPHYNTLKNYVNIAPGVSMGGGVVVGEGTFIGIGASLKQYIAIGSNVTIGAGTVVLNDVSNNSTVVGVPGRVIKMKL